MSRIVTKPTKWHVRPAKTKISLGIRPVWSESSLCVQWVAKDPSLLADNEKYGQTGRTCHFVGFVTRRLIFLPLINGLTFDQLIRFEPHRDKTNKMACAPSEASDQPGHPPNLIRVFTVRLKKARILSYTLSAQRRLWSDWADAQADLSPRWAHIHVVGLVTMRFI